MVFHHLSNMQISKNGIAIAIIIIESLLTAVGVEFDPGTVAKAVEGAVITVSILLLTWNQITRPEVDNFLFKRTEQDILK